MTELNQKLSKACPDVEAAHHRAFKRGKKYLCNKLSVQEGVCSKRACFQELIVHT